MGQDALLTFNNDRKKPDNTRTIVMGMPEHADMKVGMYVTVSRDVKTVFDRSIDSSDLKRSKPARKQLACTNSFESNVLAAQPGKLKT